jgi:ABC-type lipoprotein export system ATPase subunit
VPSGNKDLVVGEDDTYRLAVEPASVDAVEVVDLAGRASAARHAGDATTALGLASEGLRLFRGEVLIDLGDWAEPHRARLEEVRLGLLEDMMAARVDLGAGGELVGELETLVSRHPLRERLWASLMTALYRGGRQADALAAYARVRRLLIDELGVEPGPDLRALEQQLLLQSAALGGGPDLHRVTTPGNLPQRLTPLLGRSTELVALRGLVEEHRFVSVVGPAGVGKTRLLLELARELTVPGGVWLVRLEAVTSSADLEQVVAETLHVAGSAHLRERLSGAQTVLLLDNCEHVIANASALVRELLEAIPALRVLATSQVPLGIEYELVHHLEPLSTESSVALFLARAREMRRQLVVDDDAAALVEEVCRSLDGLPWPSSSPPPGCGRCPWATSRGASTTGSPCSRTPAVTRPERRRALAGRDRDGATTSLSRRPARPVGPVLLRGQRIPGSRGARPGGPRGPDGLPWWTP